MIGGVSTAGGTTEFGNDYYSAKMEKPNVRRLSAVVGDYSLLMRGSLCCMLLYNRGTSVHGNGAGVGGRASCLLVALSDSEHGYRITESE